MSTKDMDYKRICCICGDTLVGTDDGLEVYESLIEQLKALESGIDSEGQPIDFDEPGCGLCGTNCSIAEAKKIVAKGKPKLMFADGRESPEV